jgi:hypothetical protein
MYLKNLLNTTGRSPEIMTDQFKAKSINGSGMKLTQKGSRFSIAAFLLLSVLVIAGCDSTGLVGEGLVPDDSDIKQSAVEPDTFETISANTFSGRLQNSAMGYFEDPLYGNLNAVTLLKPSISRAQIEDLQPGDTMTLLLSFSSVVYGDDLAGSEFEIFEAGEIWRGNELRYNNEISVDFSNKVGEFQVTNEDSLEVELSQAWVEKLRTFFDQPTGVRDTLFVNNFPGLAIVPSAGSQNIRFIRHSREEEGSPIETRFLVYTAVEENGNGDDEDEVVGRRLDLSDWGSSVIRTDEPESTDGMVMHSIDRILKIDFDLPVEELRNRNITNATLVLTLRKDNEELFPEINRPEIRSVRGHSFTVEPSDLPSEIFTAPSRFISTINEGENTFSFNLTQYVLNEVFGERGEGPIYITLQTVNGILYSSMFYDDNAIESRRPRIVITSFE